MQWADELLYGKGTFSVRIPLFHSRMRTPHELLTLAVSPHGIYIEHVGHRRIFSLIVAYNRPNRMIELVAPVEKA